MAEYSRRLPVYLLLDCSESMAGSAIEAVKEGVNLIVNEIRCNPIALESVWLSVITFSRNAKQNVPLTDLINFKIPKLAVRPGTSLGAALRLLIQCIGKEIVKTSATEKGDYRPIVFLITDGQPTDNWKEAIQELNQFKEPKIANIYAIGCGLDVDTNVLQEISDIVLLMQEITPETIHKLFVWLSASILTASSSINVKYEEQSINLEDLPECISDKIPEQMQITNGLSRQVFLHAKCSKTKKPYLMRYRLHSSGQYYDPVSSHPLEEFEKGDETFFSNIDTSLLRGIPKCPYCGNLSAGLCSCGTILCTAENFEDSMQCPGCNAQLKYQGKGCFEIKQSLG